MKKSGKSGGKGLFHFRPEDSLLTLLFTLLAAAGVRGPEPAREHQRKGNHNQRIIHPHRETGRLYLRLQQCRHRPQARRDRARQGTSHRIHRPRMPARSQRAGFQQQGDPDGPPQRSEFDADAQADGHRDRRKRRAGDGRHGDRRRHAARHDHLGDGRLYAAGPQRRDPRIPVSRL